MIDPERYADRKFNLQNYNCCHFVREVWLDETGVDLGDYVPKPLTFASARKAFAQHEDRFVGKVVQEIREPVNPCLVYITHPREMPHVGVLVDGRLLHMSKQGKVLHEPLAPKPETRVRYFR